jgi:N-acetylmuramoyl-L-alanine amidase/uncharacterized protein YraI
MLTGVAAPALAQDDAEPSEPASGPLAGRVIVTSAGHGWTYLEDCQCYSLQRRHYGDVVEDVLNAEIVFQLNAMLTAAGATVYPTRHPDPSAGDGVSGHPRWQENARQYLMSIGSPDTVWDLGDTNLFSDIISRPLYANYVGADIFVSVHNNAGGGSGTNVIYNITNDQEAGSRALGNAIFDAVVSRIRTDYDPDWGGRGIGGADLYAELNRAQMPAALIEVAFFDTPEPDYAALRDPQFKYLAALGIYEGIVNYFAGQPAPSREPTPQFDATLEPGTLRASTAVVVRAAPSSQAAQVDVLPAGQVAYIQERQETDEGEWIRIGQDRWVAGWVVETAEGEAAPPQADAVDVVPSGEPLPPGYLRANVAAIVRSGPGMDYPQVGVLSAGDTARILDRVDDVMAGSWLQIGEDRWVSAWVVETAPEDAPAEPSPPAAAPTATAAAPPSATPTLAPGYLRANVAVIVRGGPGMDYPQVGVLSAGDTARILDRVDDVMAGSWLQIGDDQWVSAEVVETANDSAPAGAAPQDAAPNVAPSATATEATGATATPTLAPGYLRAPVAVVVRSGPGTEYGQAGVLYEGDIALALARSTDSLWLKIGEGRWVGARVVVFNGEVEALSVETP